MDIYSKQSASISDEVICVLLYFHYSSKCQNNSGILLRMSSIVGHLFYV